MKKFIIVLIVFFGVLSCAEKLVAKPDNLIPKAQMIAILKDMAIMNAARSTDILVLKENGIEPTAYIFEKYAIDSAAFVDSDRYYASLPLDYVSMYEEVEVLLTDQEKELEALKVKNDSIIARERELLRKSRDSLKVSTKIITPPQ